MGICAVACTPWIFFSDVEFAVRGAEKHVPYSVRFPLNGNNLQKIKIRSRIHMDFCRGSATAT